MCGGGWVDGWVGRGDFHACELIEQLYTFIYSGTPLLSKDLQSKDIYIIARTLIFRSTLNNL